jgi:hypothetical protein
MASISRQFLQESRLEKLDGLGRPVGRNWTARTGRRPGRTDGEQPVTDGRADSDGRTDRKTGGRPPAGPAAGAGDCRAGAEHWQSLSQQSECPPAGGSESTAGGPGQSR